MTHMKLKITMTLGPASHSPQVISSLAQSADRFRLNASHLNPTELQGWLKKLESIFSDTKKQLPVVVDLQGAKMRIGQYPKTDLVPERVKLICQSEPSCLPTVIPVPHRRLFKAVKKGELLSLNDGKIIVEVLKKCSEEIEGITIRSGPLSARKGINLADHPIPYKELTHTDKEAINIANFFPFTCFAFSFTQKGEEAKLLRDVTSKKIIAKIELEKALLDHLEEIDDLFDELWLCRGDLGAQAGIERLGALQYYFTQKLPYLKKPAYLAGEVLQHMTLAKRPTRSEIVHLFDTEQRGFEGIVLSDETAIGAHPTKVAEVISYLKNSKISLGD